MTEENAKMEVEEPVSADLPEETLVETETAAPLEIVYQASNPNPEKPGISQVVAKKDGKQASVFYDFGDNLAEMTALFGEDVVFTNSRSKMIISLQAAMRGRLKAGQSIEKLMEIYKPGVALEKLPVDMQKATEDFFAGLSPEEQDAMIARLMEKK